MAVMAPRATWTDERLDDFRAETQREFAAVRAEMRDGFARVDKKFEEVDRRFDRMDEKFDGITGRLESLQRTLIITLGTFGSGLLATLAGLVVTQH
jgi:hypothetical protein